MRATHLFEEGMAPAEIARQVGVSHQIVSDSGATRRVGVDAIVCAVLGGGTVA